MFRFRPRESQMGRRKRVLSTGNWMLSAEEEFYLRAAKIEGKLLCLSELLFFASIFASNSNDPEREKLFDSYQHKIS